MGSSRGRCKEKRKKKILSIRHEPKATDHAEKKSTVEYLCSKKENKRQEIQTEEKVCDSVQIFMVQFFCQKVMLWHMSVVIEKFSIFAKQVGYNGFSPILAIHYIKKYWFPMATHSLNRVKNKTVCILWATTLIKTFPDFNLQWSAFQGHLIVRLWTSSSVAAIYRSLCGSPAITICSCTFAFPS